MKKILLLTILVALISATGLSQSINFDSPVYVSFHNQMQRVTEHNIDELYPDSSITTRFLIFRIDQKRKIISELFAINQTGQRDTSLEKLKYHNVSVEWVNSLVPFALDSSLRFIMPVHTYDPNKRVYNETIFTLPIGYNQIISLKVTHKLILLPAIVIGIYAGSHSKY